MAIADDEVVQAFDVEQLAGLYNRSCEGDVLRGGLWRAGGMVVRDQDGRGVGTDRWAKCLLDGGK